MKKLEYSRQPLRRFTRKKRKKVLDAAYEVAINSTMDFQERRDPSISGESDAVGKLSNLLNAKRFKRHRIDYG